jgi:alkanesulfonate monooxygenase SsuD/methylene tetrahydromethanopterin reductase-like flavin-dependent oxidoreductase (luciferase family)
MQWGLRFDFRNPPIAGTSTAERYAAALDMVEWADRLGAASITVSEHHGSDDGYLPSSLPMLAAMAMRTERVRLRVAALIVPFHDPLRLAEDLAVVDNLASGRLDVVVAAGYNPAEFAMFDVPIKQRVRRVVETIETLRGAFTGEPFDFRGRTVRVTPAPYQPGGPAIVLGGSSEPAARRAAHVADGFAPSVPGVWDFYRDEMVRLGKPDPGPARQNVLGTTFLADDVDKGWEAYGPFFLHEMNAYGAWHEDKDLKSHFREIDAIEELRASSHYRVATPHELRTDLEAIDDPVVVFHPLCGGTTPDLAWRSLQLFEHEVLPNVRHEEA